MYKYYCSYSYVACSYSCYRAVTGIELADDSEINDATIVNAMQASYIASYIINIAFIVWLHGMHTILNTIQT